MNDLTQQATTPVDASALKNRLLSVFTASKPKPTQAELAPPSKPVATPPPTVNANTMGNVQALVWKDGKAPPPPENPDAPGAQSTLPNPGDTPGTPPVKSPNLNTLENKGTAGTLVNPKGWAGL